MRGGESVQATTNRRSGILQRYAAVTPMARSRRRLRALAQHVNPAGASLEPSLTAPAIDTIDISAWTTSPASASAAERAAAAAAVGASFERTGFALIVGHGIDPEIFDGVRTRAYEFFELPQEAKAHYSDGRGYGFGGYLDQEENGAQLLGDFTRRGLGDHVESVSLAQEIGTVSIGTISASRSSIPPVTDAVEGFAAATKRYFEALRPFCKTLDRLAEAALGLPEEGLLDVAKRDSGGGMRLAYYPDPADRPPTPGQQRYGAHVDSGGITILKRDADNPAGLQVQVNDVWVDVPAPPGVDSIVLNVGALLSRYTNNRWKASKHRVLNGDGARLSIVSGCVSFKSDSTVSMLPGCGTPERPLGYEPVLAGNYISERAAMHRLDYTEGKTEEELQELSNRIQAYVV